MDYIVNNKTLIMRVLGGLMLLGSLSVYFWSVPPKGLSENEKAMARIARIEASTTIKSSKSLQSKKKDDSKFLSKLKDKQAKQLQYLSIVIMLFGTGFLAYSFMPKK